jgi:hypothetical protein
MAKYEDYAPKKKKFRLFEAEDTQAPTPQEEPEAVPEKAAEEPRFCLRCTDTEMLFYRTVKLQTDRYWDGGTIRDLFRDDDEPYETALLPAEIWVCPKCRRMETVWAFSTLPGGAGLSKVWEYERTFEYCNEKQLRQILEEDKFNEDMKQAARNLLEKKFFGGK